MVKNHAKNRNETRIHPRVDVRIPVIFQIDESSKSSIHMVDESFIHGELVDISVNGAGFFIPIFIPKGIRIVLQIQAVPFYSDREGPNEYIRTMAKVIYARLDVQDTQSPKTEERFIRRYRTGVEYLKIDSSDQNAIQVYIEKNKS